MLMANFLIFVSLIYSIQAFSQNVEQKALTFLCENISGKTFINSKGSFVFNKDSCSIWYSPIIQGTNSKLSLVKATSINEENFYKIIHPFNDVYIITCPLLYSDSSLYVPFDVKTNYNIHNRLKVYFKNNEPFNILNDN